MSLFLGDQRLKACIQLGLEDIQKNLWILNDILGDSVANPYLQKLYGTQIESCKQWLANNRINIFMSARDDKVEFPCITIELGNSSEKSEMKHMADLSTETIQLMPTDINRPIPYVIKPISGSYEPISGSFTFGSAVDLTIVAPGMILVDPATGNGYVINDINTTTQIQLSTGLSLSAPTYGIVPKYQYFETRISHTFMQEIYTISCHCNDQQTLLWLHSIVTYSLLRYRQSLLEEGGFAESMIKSSGMYPNSTFSDAGQVVWSRDITIEGQVENSWYGQPHRVIENTDYIGPIKIISNLDSTEDPSNVNWVTIAESLE